MSLTGEQVRLVRESYALILQYPRRYSEIFYHQLLQDHPFARALFPDDMTRQIEVFARTIDVLIENIMDLDRMQPVLSAMAKRHVQYGVQVYQYKAVGIALIDTFDEILADNFTPEIRQAWEAVYTMTADIMIADAYSEAERIANN